jgi:hypothetical protein
VREQERLSPQEKLRELSGESQSVTRSFLADYLQ